MPINCQCSVGVFCSGDNKVEQSIKTIAYNLGKELAQHNFSLVTGASQTGLMKAINDGYSTHTADLTNLYGVIPEIFREYNVHHPAIPEKNLIWVDTLYNRLEHFHRLCKTVIILPGGFGTLHELMDFLVHNQLFQNKKKIILFNPNHFWDHLIQQFKHMELKSTLHSKHFAYIKIVESVEDCIITINNCNAETLGLDSQFWE